ncbi:hypothetical protein GA0061071_104101 [Kosakonia oryzendophytica]|uniref:Lysozyme n=1 Tax=Kosakonia oryzendophytica TaxID=1005665 RepID=A0A1C4B3N9_9ENTR|nr:hypothetical protein [Kosakonia oryzendophytica]TDT60261.1 hypothetical protein DFO53_1872 [Enterobacter sp. AG5470]SCC01439.1 hypothetical protein GA0061071_104101 [Kosakonia oryzendophytica]
MSEYDDTCTVHDTWSGPICSFDGNNKPGGTTSNGDGSRDAVGGVTDKTKIVVVSTKEYSGAYMSMCTTNLSVHEGFKNAMYQDSEGNITVGIGHLIVNLTAALALPFTRTHTTHGHGDDEDTEVSASDKDITTAFNAIKANPKAWTLAHLTNKAVIETCIKDVQTTEAGLRGLYSDYDSFPDGVKTALVDMGFNLGIGKLKSAFPAFNAAVNKKDWATAAKESHRTKISESRNTDTANQLLSAVKK